MTTVKLFNVQGAEVKTINLPKQFEEEVNVDLIKRAVLAVQNSKRQKYGAFEEAGKRSSAKLSRRRKKYRTGYGRAASRVPRKVMWRRGTQFGLEGAFAPGIKGGRRAHPPKEKDFTVKINKKERRKAIRSALAATINSELVGIRHQLPKTVPLVVEQKIEDFSRTKEFKNLLLKLGFEKEMLRLDKKKVRAGKGKLRNRKYKVKRGPLVVVSKECSLEKASRNLQGFEIVHVNSLNAELLAPGAVPGRLLIWSQPALERLEKEKLFTNSPIAVKKEKENESG